MRILVLVVVFIFVVLSARTAAEARLPDSLRAPPAEGRLYLASESAADLARPEWWRWEPRPEFGPGSYPGTGLRVAEWKSEGLEVHLHVGLHEDSRQALELLREAEAASDFPLLRVNPEYLVPEPSEEARLLSMAYGLLGWRRFVYLVVAF